MSAQPHHLSGLWTSIIIHLGAGAHRTGAFYTMIKHRHMDVEGTTMVSETSQKKKCQQT